MNGPTVPPVVTLILTQRRDRVCVGTLYGGVTCDGKTYEAKACNVPVDCLGMSVCVMAQFDTQQKVSHRRRILAR